MAGDVRGQLANVIRYEPWARKLEVKAFVTGGARYTGCQTLVEVIKMYNC